jgi:hypothetical protein
MNHALNPCKVGLEPTATTRNNLLLGCDPISHRPVTHFSNSPQAKGNDRDYKL